MKENNNLFGCFFNNIEKFEFSDKEQIAVFEDEESRNFALEKAKDNYADLVDKVEDGIVHIGGKLAIYTLTLDEISTITRNDVWGYNKVESIVLYKIEDCEPIDEEDRSKKFISKVPSEFDYFASLVHYVNKNVKIFVFSSQKVNENSTCPKNGAMTHSISLKTRNGKAKITVLSYPVEV